MKQKFIPYEKLGKKAQKAINQKKRNDWGTVRPGGKVIDENPKAYHRHPKHRKQEDNFYV